MLRKHYQDMCCNWPVTIQPNKKQRIRTGIQGIYIFLKDCRRNGKGIQIKKQVVETTCGNMRKIALAYV